ncbi:ABC transporter permease subunit [Peribacillus alkalitolerans]|uniref:ABC transporter permease subunit n=1 Tax=Peribacillus alkalitolerans TaxID=1550385 RepID=UPI0013D6E408|nr:ABC transporter permease subunit [Peribacillus alkalitolerans]
MRKIYPIGLKITSIILQFLVGIAIIILVTGLPILFDSLGFHVKEYLQYTKLLTMKLIFFDNATYWEHTELFPIFWVKYKETAIFIGSSLLIGLLFSIFVVIICYTFFFRKVDSFLRKLVIFESIPDILIISGLQLGVILIYKNYGVKLTQVISMGSERSIVLPLISLSIPASFYFIKIILLSIKNEFEKNYVLLAQSTGTTHLSILVKHITRNIIDEIWINSKTLIWILLSSMVVVEYLFNIQGVAMFILTFEAPELFVIVALSIFVPFFIAYKLYELITPQIMKGERE